MFRQNDSRLGDAIATERHLRRLNVFGVKDHSGGAASSAASQATLWAGVMTHGVRSRGRRQASATGDR